MVSKSIVFGLFVYRIVNSLILSTFFDPDEYWQLYEPAIHLVTGGSRGYLTWEWREGIRSWIYPAIIGLLWKLFPPASRVLVVKIFTGVVSALIDIYTLKLVDKTSQKSKDLEILVLITFNWFNFCYVDRALSNQLESLFVLFSWYFFNSNIFFLFMGLAFLVRPTAIIPLISPLLFKPRRFFTALITIFLFLFFQFLFDSYFYNKAIISSLNFLKVNVIQGISLHFGTNNLFYYLLCLPAIFTTLTPDVIYGIYTSQDRMAKTSVISTLILYSLLPHKEIRFIMPLVPLLFSLNNGRIVKKGLKMYVTFNILLIAYFGILHQRGSISIARYLSHGNVEGRVMVLMPCHSLPHDGFIQNNRLSIDFITCEPPLGLDKQERISYQDDTDKAYKNYPHSLVEFVDTNRDDHLVLFENLQLLLLLQQMGYRKRTSFFNGFYNPDWRRRGNILMLSRTKSD